MVATNGGYETMAFCCCCCCYKLQTCAYNKFTDSKNFPRTREESVKEGINFIAEVPGPDPADGDGLT